MWIDLTKLSQIHEAYLSSLGRALSVAQHLETTARFVLRVYEATENHGRRKSCDEMKQLMNLLGRVLLGKMVQRFEHYGEFSASDIEILKLGTEARNYIAHKSALVVSEYPDRPDELIQQIAHLKERVADLVNADNLVSSWSYEIQEKEPTPKALYDIYPSRIWSWILAPLNENVNSG